MIKMSSTLQTMLTLHNGVEIPYIGLGVYKMEDKAETEAAVQEALKIGYRSIDTASFYQNEDSVGNAIKNASIQREDIFVTTKVWNSEQGYDETLAAFDRSLKKLQMDYIDLYLVHWPVKGKYLDTWRALERLYNEGVVRAIGVSNFHIHHLETLFTKANEKPVLNQVELHPRLSQVPLRAFCAKHQVAIEAWSPLARGRIFKESILNDIAKKHGKTPAQIILRWHLQHRIIVIPKSIRAERIQENADLFDFSLSKEEMKQIDALNKDERYGKDPDYIDF